MDDRQRLVNAKAIVGRHLDGTGLKTASSDRVRVATNNGWWMTVATWDRNYPDVVVFLDDFIEVSQRHFWFGFMGSIEKIDNLIYQLPESSFPRISISEKDLATTSLAKSTRSRMSNKTLWSREYWPDHPDVAYFGLYDISLNSENDLQLCVKASRAISNAVGAVDADLSVLNDIKDIERSNRSILEKETLILARKGQGRFRSRLIDIWNGCAVSGAQVPQTLRASHIKAWRDADDDERLDENNGLLLNALLDALFDKGLISFDDAGRLLISADIPKKERERLAIEKETLSLSRPLNDQQKVYLRHHREKYAFPA